MKLIIRQQSYLILLGGIILATHTWTTGCKSPEKNTSGDKSAKGFSVDIEHATRVNRDYRRVLYTAHHLQLVLMSLKPHEEIGEEIHNENDQFFRFEAGTGVCIINGNTYHVKDGDAIIVPAGAKHNIINTDSTSELKLYTIYAPPQHKDGIIRGTKTEAESSELKFDGVTTE